MMMIGKNARRRRTFLPTHRSRKFNHQRIFREITVTEKLIKKDWKSIFSLSVAL